MGITTTQEIVLDFNRTKYNVILEHTDDENSRYILITCLSSGTLFELTDEYEIQLKVLTPDNKMLILSSKDKDSAITITDGKAKVLLTTAMLLVAGRAKAELIIKSGDSTLTSMPFEIEVVNGTYNQDAIISDPEAQSAIKVLTTEIQGYVTETKGYRDEAETVYENIKDAQTKLTDVDEKITEATNLLSTADSKIAEMKTYSAETEAAKNNANTYAIEAKSYAVGGTSSRDGEDEDNSKYYSEQAKKYRDEAQAIAGGDYINNAEKGVSNGVATLDSAGKVPSSQLPDAKSISFNNTNTNYSSTNVEDALKEVLSSTIKIATSTTTGTVKPDNTTITISDDGTLSAVPSLKIKIIEALPSENIDSNTIYFLPKTTLSENNIYNEYIYVNEKWELIGDTEVDLSEYLKSTDVIENNKIKSTLIPDISVSAAHITFDNTNTNYTSDNIQTALTEIDSLTHVDNVTIQDYIDNKIASQTLLEDKYVYFSPNGSNVTGDGSLENPYFTCASWYVWGSSDSSIGSVTYANPLDALPRNLGGHTLYLCFVAGTYTAQKNTLSDSADITGNASIQVENFYNGTIYIKLVDSQGKNASSSSSFEIATGTSYMQNPNIKFSNLDTKTFFYLPQCTCTFPDKFYLSVTDCSYFKCGFFDGSDVKGRKLQIGQIYLTNSKVIIDNIFYIPTYSNQGINCNSCDLYSDLVFKGSKISSSSGGYYLSNGSIVKLKSSDFCYNDITLDYKASVSDGCRIYAGGQTSVFNY